MFTLSRRGVKLVFVGYSEKLPALAKVVASEIINFDSIWEKVDPTLFEDIKDRSIRALESCMC